MYLLGFNPGADPSKAELNRYTIAADLAASHAPDRRDWSAFEDDWCDFGPGAVAFQRRVRHLIDACGIDSPRKVPASNAIFVRSTRVETLNAQRSTHQATPARLLDHSRKGHIGTERPGRRLLRAGHGPMGQSPARCEPQTGDRRFHRNQCTSMAEYDSSRPGRHPSCDAHASQRCGLD